LSIWWRRFGTLPLRIFAAFKYWDSCLLPSLCPLQHSCSQSFVLCVFFYII
jgi:hypothetical protein